MVILITVILVIKVTYVFRLLIVFIQEDDNMPHSGGGGSHSGGSSFSSHSSSGGGHSSGPSYSRGQSKPYPGSHRYVYYYNNAPHYYYSDRVLKTIDFKWWCWGLIGVGLFWFMLVFCLTYAFFVKVESGPLYLGSVNKDILIYDNSDLMSDSEEEYLRNYLEDFRDDTGVIFSVVTYPDHNIGRDIEVESYNEYCSMFYDEKHWLIYYVGYDQSRDDDWEWNLMCGDDCGVILNTSQERKFVNEFHANLLRDMSFSDAVIKAVDKLNPNLNGGYVYRNGVEVNDVEVGGQHVSTLSVYAWYTMAYAGLIVCIKGIINLLKPVKGLDKAKMQAKPVPEYVRYLTCEYCGGSVIMDTTTSCPYCGAHFDFR